MERNVEIQRVLDIISSNVQNANINVAQMDVNLVDLGMDSISFIHIVVELEEEFECEIPDEKLLISEMDTPKKIFDVLENINEEPTR